MEAAVTFAHSPNIHRNISCLLDSKTRIPFFRSFAVHSIYKVRNKIKSFRVEETFYKDKK